MKPLTNEKKENTECVKEPAGIILNNITIMIGAGGIINDDSKKNVVVTSTC